MEATANLRGHGRSGKSADPDDSIEDEQDTLATGDVSA
jgi:hypothetical protein